MTEASEMLFSESRLTTVRRGQLTGSVRIGSSANWSAETPVDCTLLIRSSMLVGRRDHEQTPTRSNITGSSTVDSPRDNIPRVGLSHPSRRKATPAPPLLRKVGMNGRRGPRYCLAAVVLEPFEMVSVLVDVSAPLVASGLAAS